MQYVWRFVLLLVVFVGVGLAVDHVVVSRARPGGAYAVQVRLGAAMAGLFAGAASTVLAGIAMVQRRGELDRRQ